MVVQDIRDIYSTTGSAQQTCEPARHTASEAKARRYSQGKYLHDPQSPDSLAHPGLSCARLRNRPRQLRVRNIAARLRRSHRSGSRLLCYIAMPGYSVLSDTILLLCVTEGRRMDGAKIQHAVGSRHYTRPRR